MGDRSRSPNGRSDWISKQVVFFGRYEQKRPSGLHVDSSGAFTLSSLMQCWGDSQGISKEDVIRAIKQNMWSNAGAQRFELEESGGDHLIRATGKKAAGGSNSWSSNGGGGGGGGGQASWSASGGSSWSQPAATKEKASWDTNSSWNDSGNSWDKDNGGGKSWDTKSWEKDSSGDQSWQKEDNSWDKGAEKDKWGKSSSSTSWGSKSWNDQSSDTPDAEKVQRWVGWALKSGAHDLGLYVQSGGWASIDDLAKEIASRKPDFGIADGDALAALIRSSDSEGRFEVDEHRRLRKVARDQRQHGQHQQGNHWEQQPQHSQQQQQQQDSWQQPWQQQQQQQQSSHKVLQQQPKASGPTGSSWGSSAAPGGYLRPGSGARGGGGGGGAEAPSLPPGPGWTEYVDSDVYWWYYEGPLGKWWMSETDEAPMPWTEG